MKKNIFYIVSLLVTFCLLSIQTSGQELETLNKTEIHNQKNNARAAFEEIESGISSGEVGSISEYLSPQTYLSLSNGISGYYSSNQAYYILEDFFKSFQAVSFKFDNVQTEEGNFYATGTYKYASRGKRGTAQVFVSIKHSGKKWKITQFTIN